MSLLQMMLAAVSFVRRHVVSCHHAVQQLSYISRGNSSEQ